MNLDITKKPLIKSISQLGSIVKLFTEVTGSKPSRIEMSISQYAWYLNELNKMAEELNLQLKKSKLEDPTFDGIKIGVKNV